MREKRENSGNRFTASHTGRGEGGIRTPGAGVTDTTVFETAAIVHSATSPRESLNPAPGWFNCSCAEGERVPLERKLRPHSSDVMITIHMVSILRQGLWLVGVPLAILAGGVAGWASVFVMGLAVPIFLVGPLSLLSGASLATISAGWFANIVRWRQSRSRLLLILVFSLIGAAAALLPYLGAAWVVNVLDLPPSLLIATAVYLSGALVFVAVTTLAVWRLRAPTTEGLTWDVGLTLLLLVAVPALIAGTIFAGCSLTYFGA